MDKQKQIYFHSNNYSSRIYNIYGLTSTFTITLYFYFDFKDNKTHKNIGKCAMSANKTPHHLSNNLQE